MNDAKELILEVTIYNQRLVRDGKNLCIQPTEILPPELPDDLECRLRARKAELLLLLPDERASATKAMRSAEMRQRPKGYAARAADLLAKSRPADPGHPYLVKKHVEPHGARQIGAQLVLPVNAVGGGITSLQFIAPDGTKMLLPGGRKHACCITVSDPPDPWRTIICEGWATGASIAEADPAARVLAAIDAGNLANVSRSTRRRWSSTKIVVAGDANDVSRRAAHAAALAVRGLVLIPEIEGADWNDMAQMAAAREAAP